MALERTQIDLDIHDIVRVGIDVVHPEARVPTVRGRASADVSHEVRRRGSFVVVVRVADFELIHKIIRSSGRF